jgi:hypothetical protein
VVLSRVKKQDTANILEQLFPGPYFENRIFGERGKQTTEICEFWNN